MLITIDRYTGTHKGSSLYTPQKIGLKRYHFVTLEMLSIFYFY